MMFRRAILAVVLLLIVASVSAQTASSAKGYELYSWKIKKHWYYSLLPRTDKPKTYEEITANTNARRGTSGLSSALEKLPRGEEVFWMGDAPAKTKSVTASGLSLKHPSRKRIKHIKAICDKLGIKLSLA
jgi:trehalose-6-phosphate synthase